ncbi:MAG: hypothetical protein HZB52_05040 [Chloroflexi bacterium]|nr:hypothetical protein [Chloroflexota bacterium]
MKRLLTIFFLFISSCAAPTPSPSPTQSLAPTAVAASPVAITATTQSQPKEQAVTIIPLSGDLQNSKAEISGLAWYKDYLIVMPQYPNFRSAAGDGRLFAIPKADIIAFLDGKTKTVSQKEIPFFASGITQKIKGYQGFEAIEFKEDRVYMTIEAEPGGMMAYLVRGTIKPDLSEIRLDANVLIEMKPQADVSNASNESLMVMNDRLISFYEGNGAKLNPKPVGYAFALPTLEVMPPIPFPNIEYRITDATTADADGKFWAINYFFPSESVKYKTGEDALAKKFGKGATHAKQLHVERLVEFQYAAGGITLTNIPPIQLLLENDARNWEGIARLEGRGFLIATDEHPKTILGFVSMP